MKGNITRRGDAQLARHVRRRPRPATRKRKVHSVTVHGTKREAQAELTRLMAAFGAGTLVEPSKVTLESYLRSWIDVATLASAVRPRKGTRN